MVFRENALVAAFETALGVGAALLAPRAFASFLYGTSVRDPWVLLGSVAALTLIAAQPELSRWQPSDANNDTLEFPQG